MLLKLEARVDERYLFQRSLSTEMGLTVAYGR